MAKLVLFNKPFQVLCQFSRSGDKQTLADYIDMPDVYAAGRLDYDSEGLLLLTDDGKMQAQISNPAFKRPKVYLAQVEKIPDRAALASLRRGVKLKQGITLPAKARLVDEPDWIWPRHPPIRQRLEIPTQWLELEITEGKNRQVRRMTAAVGYPTLRLIRVSVANWSIDGLAPGQFKVITV